MTFFWSQGPEFVGVSYDVHKYARGCCVPGWRRLWRLASSYELQGEQPGRTMIPKCRRARSGKPVFKRRAKRSNPCHCACLRTDHSLIFGPSEFQWQATLAACQRRPSATRALAFPETPSAQAELLGCLDLMRCRCSPEIDTGHCEQRDRLSHPADNYNNWWNWPFRLDLRRRVKLISKLHPQWLFDRA